MIDLNADLGEGFGNWRMGDDDALLDIVSSANIACGYHAGDPVIMRRICAGALESDVSIGAHVGYRDLPGFGRRFIEMEPERLTDEVLYQIAALDGFARIAGGRVAYVKPHGALYNAIVWHEEQAAALVDAVTAYDQDMPVLGLPGSAWLRLAGEAMLPCVAEAFADRAYTARGTLVPRGEPGAVLHDPRVIAERVLALAKGEPITDIEGDPLHLSPGSVCLHGDTDGAVAIARQVRTALDEAGITVTGFAK